VVEESHLQPQVYAPGIVPISDIQLVEGFADFGRKYGKNPDMMDTIAKWRTGAIQNTAWRLCSCSSYQPRVADPAG
jgi:hypothetical protein